MKPPARILTLTQRRALSWLQAAGGVVRHARGDTLYLNLCGASLKVLAMIGAVETDGAITRITDYGRSQAQEKGDRHAST